MTSDMPDYPDWFSSISSLWLLTLRQLTGSYGPGYPLYMQSKPFPVKQLQTFLGSYSGLKHDTILYAKEPSASGCGGDDMGKRPPVPKGFVEPNLPFWFYLRILVEQTYNGFKEHNLLERDLDKDSGKLYRFREQIDFYTEFARKELTGDRISGDDYEKLRTMDISYMADPPEGVVLTEEDKRSAIIADVYTDGWKKEILYEAIGKPYVMLALVGNEGTSRLTIGVSFNDYEFTAPLVSRLSDSDWQDTVYLHPEKLPPKNFWYEILETPK